MVGKGAGIDCMGTKVRGVLWVIEVANWQTQEQTYVISLVSVGHPWGANRKSLMMVISDRTLQRMCLRTLSQQLFQDEWAAEMDRWFDGYLVYEFTIWFTLQLQSCQACLKLLSFLGVLWEVKRVTYCVRWQFLWVGGSRTAMNYAQWCVSRDACTGVEIHQSTGVWIH